MAHHEAAVSSAYCSGCGRRVDLSPDGECPQGHLRSMLRDVRKGVAAPVLGAGAPKSRTPRGAAATAEPTRFQELLAQVIGKSVVIVPVAAVIAFGLWTGYESMAGTGASAVEAILMSVGSLALTVGLAFAWAARRGRRH